MIVHTPTNGKHAHGNLSIKQSERWMSDHMNKRRGLAHVFIKVYILSLYLFGVPGGGRLSPVLPVLTYSQ